MLPLSWAKKASNFTKVKFYSYEETGLFREEKAAQAKNGLLTAIIIPFKNSDKKRCPVNIIFHQGKVNSIQKTVNDEGEAR